jgi:hypothetical protein
LVQWSGCAASEASWETVDDFKKRYPDFQLEDELFAEEGSNVMANNRWGQYYVRRVRKES